MTKLKVDEILTYTNKSYHAIFLSFIMQASNVDEISIFLYKLYTNKKTF